MIANKVRESRRGRSLKMSKNIERLYKEGKCREFSVVVTRMNFAKILGKFTKVKIQYVSSSTTKTKQNDELVSPNSNARLKSNENGMVLIHRNAYNQHPVNDLITTKKAKITENNTPRQVSNVLKENNRLKKTPTITKDKNSNYNKKNNSNLKHYGIMFINPTINNNNDFKSKVSLVELLPVINKSILPSEEWCIDYFPKSEEPKEDKVYDRIAAELEDLMYNEKPADKPLDKVESVECKTEDFPSIMDILNDNSSESESKPNDHSNPMEFKTALESSDVEAMLLGKSNNVDKPLETIPIDVSNDVSTLIADVDQFTTIEEAVTKEDIKPKEKEIENPHSPSILDEALQKGIEEHLPCDLQAKEETPESNVDPKSTEENSNVETSTNASEPQEMDLDLKEDIDMDIQPIVESKIPEININNITHVVFKKTEGGICSKSVTCPKNMKYNIELHEKSVELLGAPKFISSLEDLQVLLQIVNETEPDSLYVL